jgi:antitoxin component of MazEF toxin-antitoxin module
LPKVVVEALNLREGGKVLLRVARNSVVLESVQDPIQLALEGKKFASTTPEEIERISLDQQRSGAQDPA